MFLSIKYHVIEEVSFYRFLKELSKKVQLVKF